MPFPHRYRRAFTVPELLMIALVVLVLLALILPVLRQNRNSVRETHRSGIAATLTRIEKAKTAYAAEGSLKPGAPITMTDLVRRGYLDKEPGGDGIRYSVNAVGMPVTYEFSGAAK